MYNCHSNTILHHITFSGNITREAYFKKTINVTEQEMYMSYKQLQHASKYYYRLRQCIYFLITYYQVNAHCVVQIITKVETYT